MYSMTLCWGSDYIYSSYPIIFLKVSFQSNQSPGFTVVIIKHTTGYSIDKVLCSILVASRNVSFPAFGFYISVSAVFTLPVFLCPNIADISIAQFLSFISIICNLAGQVPLQYESKFRKSPKTAK
jgi:hypothetical protein